MLVLGEDRLDALQERDRDGAAHAAAVERQDPLRARPEQVAVAGIRGLEEIFDDARRIGRSVTPTTPVRSPVLAGGTPSPAAKWHGRAGQGQGRKAGAASAALAKDWSGQQYDRLKQGAVAGSAAAPPRGGNDGRARSGSRTRTAPRRGCASFIPPSTICAARRAGGCRASASISSMAAPPRNTASSATPTRSRRSSCCRTTASRARRRPRPSCSGASMRRRSASRRWAPPA